MNYKVVVGILAIPWAIAAFLTAVMYQDVDVANLPASDAAAVASFLNTSGNPESINVSEPAVGSTNNPISTTYSWVNTASDWLPALARGASLTGPIWQPWTAPIRFILYLLVAPALLMLTLSLAQAFSFFISSIFGRTRV